MHLLKISHSERMQALMTFQALDRIPIALWRHFPVDDQDPETLAEATLNFQNLYDLDLVKVTPASSFCLKDWGAEDCWEGNSEGTRRYTKHVIQSPQDWEKLHVIQPTAKYLSKQLECLSILRKNIGSETPIIQTIFNPLSQAKNLAGGEVLINHIRLFPEAVQKGLDTIAKTTKQFIESAIGTGIAGIFFAVQHAQASLLTKQEYINFGKEHDLKLLECSKGLWCNILHLHGSNVYFDIVKEYPVNILNWHDRDTPPSLHDAHNEYPGILCGGIKRETICFGTPAEIKTEIDDAISQVDGTRLLLGTGCVIPSISPHGNIKAARNRIEKNES